jgi:ferric-dicitrate binding protein FerR (iron transport regulator)
MLLNTGTEVEVAMTKSARNVYLNRDETFLNVTRDPQRVFTLHTGDACVKVLGTELDAQSPDGTKIAVASGMVKAGAQSKKDYPDGHAIRTANEAAGRDAT